MTKIADLGDDTYGYIAGQGSSYIVNAIMASTDAGKKMVESELTEDTVNSDEFANAFKTAAKLDQANGSEHTTDDNGNLMAEFNTNGNVGVLLMVYGMQVELMHHWLILLNQRYSRAMLRLHQQVVDLQ